jgi:hypothetical protein
MACRDTLALVIEDRLWWGLFIRVWPVHSVMSKVGLHSARGAGGLWAITSYFNPMGYRRRLANDRVFRENLNVPLVTIELAYGPEF